MSKILGAVFMHNNISTPVFFVEDGYTTTHITMFRVYLTDEEIQQLVAQPLKDENWQQLAIGYSEVTMELTFQSDDKWAQMLVDFQAPIYESHRILSEPSDFPIIHCSKEWLREFVKFYNGQHEFAFGYSKEPVFDRHIDKFSHARTVDFEMRINSSPIEVVERDGIWAQYEVGNLRVTSGGYDVLIEEIEGA